MNKIKCLSVEVYKFPLGDGTNDGVSGKYGKLLIPCDDGEIDIIFRVYDTENGKDNVLVWTSRPTEYSHWIEMILTSISTKAKLKEIIGMGYPDLAEISFIGCNGTVSIGSMVYVLDDMKNGIKECYEHYYKGE